MEGGAWTGSIFLRDEGGYAVVLRALRHYRRRLAGIGASPEVKGAPVFGRVVVDAASRAGPRADDLLGRLPRCLADPEETRSLEEFVPLMRSALAAYASSLSKAAAGEGYYAGLLSAEPVPEGEEGEARAAISRLGGPE